MPEKKKRGPDPGSIKYNVTRICRGTRHVTNIPVMPCVCGGAMYPTGYSDAVQCMQCSAQATRMSAVHWMATQAHKPVDQWG